MIFMFAYMNTWTKSRHMKEQYDAEIQSEIHLLYWFYYTGLITESPSS